MVNEGLIQPLNLVMKMHSFLCFSLFEERINQLFQQFTATHAKSKYTLEKLNNKKAASFPMRPF